MDNIKNSNKRADSSAALQTLTEKEYTRSRAFFIAEGSFATGIGTMASGVIISGILKFLGAPDSVNGIISGIPVFAGILLVFMPLIFGHLTKVKLTVTLFGVVHRLLFALMLSVPLIIKGPAARLYVFVIIYTLGYLLGTFVGPSASNWLISLVPTRIRGRYLGLREGTMIATMTVVSILIGVIIDHMKSIGNEALGYGICTIIIFAFTVLNFLCLINIKEPPLNVDRKKITLKTILSAPLLNKNFRKIFTFTSMWSFSFQIGGPFFAIYLYSVLGLNYTYIMLMNVLMYIVRVFAAQIWGRLADRKNWEFITRLSLIVLSVAHTGYIFMNSNTYIYIFPIIQILAGIGWGGVNISIFNLQFEYAPEENRTAYISVNTAAASIAGFSAILIASAIVRTLGEGQITVAGLSFNIMQFLFLASGMFIMLTAFYVKKFLDTGKNSN